MSDGMTWQDQYNIHRANVGIFTKRKQYYSALSVTDKKLGRGQDSLRHRLLSIEYRDKAIMEREQAAKIKALHLTKSPPAEQP